MDHEAVTGCLPASDFPQQGQPEVARVHVKSLSFQSTVVTDQIIFWLLRQGVQTPCLCLQLFCFPWREWIPILYTKGGKSGEMCSLLLNWKVLE